MNCILLNLFIFILIWIYTSNWISSTKYKVHAYRLCNWKVQVHTEIYNLGLFSCMKTNKHPLLVIILGDSDYCKSHLCCSYIILILLSDKEVKGEGIVLSRTEIISFII